MFLMMAHPLLESVIVLIVLSSSLWLTKYALCENNLITVYYDDLCGMCSKEINFYKRISKKNLIKWVPLSSPQENLKNDNLKLSDALLHLHAKDSAGKFHIGVAVSYTHLTLPTKA